MRCSTKKHPRVIEEFNFFSGSSVQWLLCSNMSVIVRGWAPGSSWGAPRSVLTACRAGITSPLQRRLVL